MDSQNQALWEPAPAWMDKLSLMGARFIEGNTNDGQPSTGDGGTKQAEDAESGKETGAEDKNTEDTGNEKLGENGIKALNAEREARKKAESELKDAQAEIQRLQNENTNSNDDDSDREAEPDPRLVELELRLTRSEILLGLDHPIPKEYQHLVKGDSKEEIEASAKAISELVNKPGVVEKSGSGDGETGGTVSSGRQLYALRNKKN